MFSDFAKKTARAAGHPIIFALAGGVVVLWLITGPLFGFSDTWQLIINTGTTIITFLMVFLIQNSQNRDARAIQLKLDELIRATQGPRNQLINLENCGEEELAQLEAEFKQLKERLEVLRAPEVLVLPDGSLRLWGQGAGLKLGGAENL